METLPLEMVKEISHYLTLQDMAHCIAVSRGWREAFNHDILWRPHCDPELEETLKNTPCTVKPVFIIPEDKESTLSPICRWRVAFMREEHLRRNFKSDFTEKHYLEKRYCRESASVFLTDTLLIRLCLSAIELWDVSQSPVTMLMKTDPSIVVERWMDCTVVGSDTLVVMRGTSVQVFLVDLLNKSITLEHEIQFNERHVHFVVKHFDSVDHSIYYLGVPESTQNCLTVWDVKKGIKIKLECFPLERDHGNIMALHSSALSEDILVLYENGCYVYSVKLLCYIFGPTCHKCKDKYEHLCRINQHFLAKRCWEDDSKLEIVDYLTSETIFDSRTSRIESVEVLHNCFIFLEQDHECYSLRLFSLSTKTVSCVFKCDSFGHPQSPFGSYVLKKKNNKTVVIYGAKNCYMLIQFAVFQYSHSSLRRVDMDFPRHHEVFNESFTRGFYYEWGKGNQRRKTIVRYYW